jgi:RNA polymerase sigma-70 factor (ECF subfamily)
LTLSFLRWDISVKAKGLDPDEHIVLLRRIAAGSEQALSDFYQAFHSSVYAFALKLLKDPVDSAEILNEVMMEVWRCAIRFEGRSKARTWVMGITHHKIVDQLRKRGRYKTEEIDPNIPDEDSSMVIDAIVGAENAKFIRRCMEKLSDAHHQVVHLTFFEDLSYPEIAQILNCPLGTVKTRMFHAKQLLKKCLSRLMKK